MKAKIKFDKKSKPFVIIVTIVLILAIIIGLVVVKGKRIEEVESLDKLVERLNVRIVTPQDSTNVKYGIENKNIARIEYSKEVSDGYTMDFVLKSSSSTEDLVEYDNDFSSIAIMMTVICNDGSDVEVTSYVAADDTNIMKSEWYDNDLYYAMTTETLSSREDFLQEVNKVIIDTHDDFS